MGGKVCPKMEFDPRPIVTWEILKKFKLPNIQGQI